jgi:hypothetical protein
MGTGGCGKSTIMKAQMKFWPSHLRGIISANMQQKFGLGDCAGCTVCFCSEVTRQFGLMQEEWQNCSSKEAVSLAVKFKSTIKMDWIAPFMWAGNADPDYNNSSGQVSRRLAGVRMLKPVRPRDGDMGRNIEACLGHLQRKEVLAYWEFRRLIGKTDPMSEPDHLPPAFKEYYQNSLRQSDPIVEFITDPGWIVMEDTTMYMSDFRTAFNEFRAAMGYQKSLRGWGPEVYRNAFEDNGIAWKYDPSLHDDLITGLRLAVRAP